MVWLANLYEHHDAAVVALMMLGMDWADLGRVRMFLDTVSALAGHSLEGNQ